MFGMKVVRPRRPRGIWTVAWLWVAALPAAAGAQDRAMDCRCLDAAGNEIQNCICIRSPMGVGAAPVLNVFGAARARIGVTLEEDMQGARVSDVESGSPAAAAGIVAGDVIVRVDGRSLREPLPDARRERALDESGDVAVQRLMALARDWEPGRTVQVELLRAGERRTLAVTPEAAPARVLEFAPGGEVRAFGGGVGAPLLERFRLDSLPRPEVLAFGAACGVRGQLGAGLFGCVDGVQLTPLNPDLGQYFGSSEGALVTAVAEGSPLGLRAGDVILSIGGRPVRDADEARRILASYGAGEDVPMRVLRRGTEVEVSGRRR